LRRFRIDAQFPGCGGKILLQDLNGNNQQTGPLVVGDELNCARLLGWRRRVVGVDENVWCRKMLAASSPLVSSSRLNFHPRESP